MIRLLAAITALAAAFVAGALTVVLLPAAESGRWHVRDEKDAPLRWSDTGEAVETYQTFNYPTGTLHTFTGTIQNGKPVTLRSVS